jgi:hypothetical protein
VWVRYAEMEEANNQEERVREIFRRTLYSAFSVEVWTFYLGALRLPPPCSRPDPERAPAGWLARTSRGEKGRATLMEAFEEAVKPKNVGCAMDASGIWRSYLDFLLSDPPRGRAVARVHDVRAEAERAQRQEAAGRDHAGVHERERGAQGAVRAETGREA